MARGYVPVSLDRKFWGAPHSAVISFLSVSLDLLPVMDREIPSVASSAPLSLWGDKWAMLPSAPWPLLAPSSISPRVFAKQAFGIEAVWAKAAARVFVNLYELNCLTAAQRGPLHENNLSILNVKNKAFAGGSIEAQEEVFSVLHPSFIIIFITCLVCEAALSQAEETWAAIHLVSPLSCNPFALSLQPGWGGGVRSRQICPRNELSRMEECSGGEGSTGWQ